MVHIRETTNQKINNFYLLKRNWKWSLKNHNNREFDNNAEKSKSKVDHKKKKKQRKTKERKWAKNVMIEKQNKKYESLGRKKKTDLHVIRKAWILHFTIQFLINIS